MLKFIDDFLNKITMYRIILYTLIFLFIISLILSLFSVLPFTAADLIASLLIILFTTWLVNIIFSYVYEAPINVESVYITALILFFIITPAQGGVYSEFLPVAIWASIWSMASKYILAIKNKHIFNPAAFAVALTALTVGLSASWWIGTPSMLPFVLLSGLLVVRKIKRTDMVLSFSIGAIVMISVLSIMKGGDVVNTIWQTLTNSAFFFFAFIMLTEPLTAPTTKWLRVAYGIMVGLLFAPALHIGSVYSTPELALVIGNIFAYIVSPKEKLILKLKNRVKVGTDTYDFIFEKNRSLKFKPGQYMEWTLAHRDPDRRGNRRYFTIASSPTESELHLGVKFYPEPSSFKNHLVALPLDGEIIAHQVSGDFVMPTDKKKGLVFIAGGIGVTPFRSMIKYLIDTKENRDVTMLYSNRAVADISYKEVFDQAQKELGIKTIYAVTNKGEVLNDVNMRGNPIDAEMIKKEINNYTSKIYYISGPHGMVSSFESMLESIGVPSQNIKTDFFPGFA